MILVGDNLEILNLRRSYLPNRLHLYRPPYNADGDFVYPDNYREPIKSYKQITGEIDEEGNKTTTKTEVAGAYHGPWLDMIYPRLLCAWNLLANDGLIMLSIGNEEMANLSSLCNEIFGYGNHVVTITWEQGRKNDAALFSDSIDYILIYAKDKSELIHSAKIDLIEKYPWVDGRTEAWRLKPKCVDEILLQYSKLLKKHKTDHNKISKDMVEYYNKLPSDHPAKELKHYKFSDEKGLYFGADISSASKSIQDYDVIHPGTKKPCKKPSRGWGCNEDTMKQRIKDGLVHFHADHTKIPLYKKYIHQALQVKVPYIYKDGRAATKVVDNLLAPKAFSNPKDHEVGADLFAYCQRNKALIIDFFAGAGTTAHSTIDLNLQDGGTRRFILIQLDEPLDIENKNQKHSAEFCDSINKPRNIAEITKERVRRVSNTIRKENPDYEGDLGFKVFKLDSSNIKAWAGGTEDLQKSLEDYVNHIKDDRTSSDILYEMMLKSGIELTADIQTVEVGGNKIVSVDGCRLLTCLDDEIKSDAINDVASKMIELKKENTDVECTVLFLDKAFPDDSAKLNMSETLKQSGIDNIRSI